MKVVIFFLLMRVFPGQPPELLVRKEVPSYDFCIASTRQVAEDALSEDGSGARYRAFTLFGGCEIIKIDERRS